MKTKIKFKTLILICRFCGKQTGTYQYPSALNVEDLKIADVRCEDCEIKYGSYKQMHDEFLQDIGNHDEFLKIIKKADYKKENFGVEIQKIKTMELEPVLGGVKKKKLKFIQKRGKI